MDLLGYLTLSNIVGVLKLLLSIVAFIGVNQYMNARPHDVHGAPMSFLDKEKSAQGLNSASGFVRRALAKSLDLRHIPKITFLFDDSLEYAERIERVIREMKEGGGQ